MEYCDAQRIQQRSRTVKVTERPGKREIGDWRTKRKKRVESDEEWVGRVKSIWKELPAPATFGQVRLDEESGF